MYIHIYIYIYIIHLFIYLFIEREMSFIGWANNHFNYLDFMN